MEKKIIFHLKNLILPVLGSIFLLSAIGKVYDLESFKQLINKYGFYSSFSYFIITIEIAIAISFIFFLKIKKGLIFASFFTLFITIVYIYGYLIHYLYVHARIFTYMYIHKIYQVCHIYIEIYIYIYTYMYIYIYIYAYIYIHIYIYIYIYR